MQNTAEIVPFPQNGGKTPNDLIKVYIVFEVDSFDNKRTAVVDGAFSSPEYASEYIESRDPKYLISYEVEEHTLDFHKWFE